MCTDFHAINALQPKVVKADSKAKGNLTLHPLPNIDQLYAKLRGAKVYTTLDLRSGYYHIELGKGSHAKTAFVTPFGSKYASKYAWAGVLTQAYHKEDKLTPSSDGTKKTRTVHHPIAYVSGLFRGSQLNWAALTKEAYAIYLSVRKLSFYLTSADILIRSDHLSLKKFLHKNTRKC